jgi:hypothetical protein
MRKWANGFILYLDFMVILYHNLTGLLETFEQIFVPQQTGDTVPTNLLGFGEVWRHGWLVAYLTSAYVSPLTMSFLIWFVEERPLKLKQQYFSFIIGNSAALAPIIATTALMVGTLPPGDHWWTSTTWNVACLVVAAALGPAQAVMEYFTGAFTPAQFRSPAKLYHNTLVYAVLAYRIFSATIPAIGCSADGFGGSTFGWQISAWHIHAPGWQFYLVLAAVGVFFAMVAYDSNPKHAKPDAHVEFSWQRFWHGQRQTYPQTRGWKRLRWFPPQLALPVEIIAMAAFFWLLTR